MSSHIKLVRNRVMKTHYACDNCARDITNGDIEKYFNNGEDHFDFANPDDILEFSNETKSCIPCPNCEEEVEVNVRIEGYGENWEPGHEFVRFMGFDSINFEGVEQPDFDSTRPIGEVSGYFEDEFNNLEEANTRRITNLVSNRDSLDSVPISLVIIAKTRMNRGHCYIGYSKEDNKLFRPIYTTQEGACCWSSNVDFKIDNWYGFRALASESGVVECDDKTPLPHNSNDIVVLSTYKTGQPFDDDLFDSLKPLAYENVDEIFSNVQEDKYVNEGEATDSVGLLLLKGNKISVREQYGKTRVFAETRNGKTYNWSYTGIQNNFDKITSDNTELIAIIGLARPWGGRNGDFDPKRCYILCLGFIYEQVSSVMEHLGGKRIFSQGSTQWSTEDGDYVPLKKFK